MISPNNQLLSDQLFQLIKVNVDSLPVTAITTLDPSEESRLKEEFEHILDSTDENIRLLRLQYLCCCAISELTGFSVGQLLDERVPLRVDQRNREQVAISTAKSLVVRINAASDRFRPLAEKTPLWPALVGPKDNALYRNKVEATLAQLAVGAKMPLKWDRPSPGRGRPPAPNPFDPFLGRLLAYCDATPEERKNGSWLRDILDASCEHDLHIAVEYGDASAYEWLSSWSYVPSGTRSNALRLRKWQLMATSLDSCDEVQPSNRIATYAQALVSMLEEEYRAPKASPWFNNFANRNPAFLIHPRILSYSHGLSKLMHLLDRQFPSAGENGNPRLGSLDEQAKRLLYFLQGCRYWGEWPELPQISLAEKDLIDNLETFPEAPAADDDIQSFKKWWISVRPIAIGWLEAVELMIADDQNAAFIRNLPDLSAIGDSITNALSPGCGSVTLAHKLVRAKFQEVLINYLGSRLAKA